MEVVKNDQPLSQQVDLKKMKSDFYTFNHQQDFDFKRPDKFFTKIANIARKLKVKNSK